MGAVTQGNIVDPRTEVLLVHCRHGVVEVPLTGDAALDALLARVAARGGAVTRNGALVSGKPERAP